MLERCRPVDVPGIGAVEWNNPYGEPEHEA
jgi:hypothetical protein